MMSDERTAASVYRGFIDAVNRKDLDAAERFVDPERYRENCVGFTRGFVGWDVAKDSIRQVWKGIPDLHVELPQILADESVVLAHGTVTGTATGRLYGAPATKRGYEASFFDFVRVDEGRIIERVQQADVLGQMGQLYGKALGTVGLAAMFWRLLSRTGAVAARFPGNDHGEWVVDRTSVWSTTHSPQWPQHEPIPAQAATVSFAV